MKGSKRKQEIYAASARLFRKKGYAAASVRDIAELVGLEPSSLYSHIKSKEEILINICQDCAELFADGMALIQASEKKITEKLDSLIDLHIDIAYNNPSSVTVFNDEWRHLPEKELFQFLVKRKAYEDNFKKILKSGMEAGDFEHMSLTTTFNIIINSVKWLHFFAKKLEKEAFEVKREEIKTFIRRGIYSS
ncbi:MAG: AcrR family transcriptional regulator [Saprospiraceae bacterium]|jgi:AcrR family transcriptional regulator|tara:strand:- start:1543 stop:2118 length:576 start_codon:yes stop_codon:yes gene_type:complete